MVPVLAACSMIFAAIKSRSRVSHRNGCAFPNAAAASKQLRVQMCQPTSPPPCLCANPWPHRTLACKSVGGVTGQAVSDGSRWGTRSSSGDWSWFAFSLNGRSMLAWLPYCATIASVKIIAFERLRYSLAFCVGRAPLSVSLPPGKFNTHVVSDSGSTPKGKGMLHNRAPGTRTSSLSCMFLAWAINSGTHIRCEIPFQRVMSRLKLRLGGWCYDTSGV